MFLTRNAIQVNMIHEENLLWSVYFSFGISIVLVNTQLTRHTYRCHNGGFTLPDTEAETDTDADKMSTRSPCRTVIVLVDRNGSQ